MEQKRDFAECREIFDSCGGMTAEDSSLVASEEDSEEADSSLEAEEDSLLEELWLEISQVEQEHSLPEEDGLWQEQSDSKHSIDNVAMGFLFIGRLQNRQKDTTRKLWQEAGLKQEQAYAFPLDGSQFGIDQGSLYPIYNIED